MPRPPKNSGQFKGYRPPSRKPPKPPRRRWPWAEVLVLAVAAGIAWLMGAPSL